MMRVVVVIALSTALASPAFADATIKQISNGRALGFGGKTPGTTYLKGTRMRADAEVDGRIQSTIFDLEAQKMYVFDSRKKEAEVWDMAAFSAELSKSVDTANMKTSFTPNGQTKEISGQAAAGYDVEMSVPFAMGGNDGPAMTVTLTGVAWVVKGAPGTDDYAQFYKAAAEKGWIFGNPSAAKAQPGQARALAEMYRQIADLGGIPYEMDMQMKMGAAGGGNPLGGLLARMGNASMTTTVLSIETTALPDDMFAPPAGYKLNQKK